MTLSPTKSPQRGVTSLVCTFICASPLSSYMRHLCPAVSPFPSPALLPKVTPEHIDSRLAARQCCSCFLSPRENSLLHRKSFYLCHSCFQPLEVILQPDLPTFHAKFHARLFPRHKLLLLIVTISEKWLNTWLTNYDEIQEISVQPQLSGITSFSSSRVTRKERQNYLFDIFYFNVQCSFSVQHYFICYFEGSISYVDAALPFNLIPCGFIEEKIEQGYFFCRGDDKENTKNEHTPHHHQSSQIVTEL